ncbi:MAG: hypothetical protein J6M05_01235 [Cardiobacteriaceae bacterium]|nr:hypothetical protein [Cardiobacteriaceae bacterium]
MLSMNIDKIVKVFEECNFEEKQETVRILNTMLEQDFADIVDDPDFQELQELVSSSPEIGQKDYKQLKMEYLEKKFGDK